MVTAQARHTWAAVGWVGAVVATALNGFVVGYGAAAVVLALAIPAIVAHRAPPWLARPAGASTMVPGLLAANSAAASARAEPVSSSINTAWDGVGGVLWALGIHGAYRLAVAGRSVS